MAPERGVRERVLPPQGCKELLFILNSLAVQGNRPAVQSATIHDIAHAQPELLVPLVRAREAVQSCVEEMFARELELFPEFTALMAWGPGSSIGWHFDSNRDYLKSRDYAAVLYLSDSGKDFEGGDFHFQDGSPARVVPAVGKLVAYGAKSDNVHSVEPVTWGVRATLTMWFSLDAAALEDTAVLTTLRNRGSGSVGLPEEMYTRESGADVRITRLAAMGFVVDPCTPSVTDCSSMGPRVNGENNEGSVAPGRTRRPLSPHVEMGGRPGPAPDSGGDSTECISHLWLELSQPGVPRDRVWCSSVQHASLVGHFLVLLQSLRATDHSGANCSAALSAATAPSRPPCSREVAAAAAEEEAGPITAGGAAERLASYLQELGGGLRDVAARWEAAGHLHTL